MESDHLDDHIKANHMQSIESYVTLSGNLRRALDESSIVSIMNKDKIITHVNDNFCRVSKYSREELLGKSHKILRSEEHPIEYYENLWEIVSNGKVWHGEVCNKAKDDTLFWNKITIIPFFDIDGKISEYVTVRNDITSQKELSMKLLKAERLSSIGQLASRMSHDIRNPLSIIQITLDNLKTMYGQDDTKQKQFEKVERSIGRITHQIDDVLDFVKGHSPNLFETKFSEIISESVDSIILPSDIKLILPKNDTTFLCDEKLFSVSLNNLILNAIQAIDGVGVIEITLDENNEAIVIQVKDSGKGIEKEIIDKIFDPLFTTKETGTGLGLAGVKSIIEAHGGIISVISPPTIFTITLPKISN